MDLLSSVTSRCRTLSLVAYYHYPLARQDVIDPFQAGVMVGM